MTEKARHRLAARAHKQFVKESERLRRGMLRTMRSLYPLRVGQYYADAEGHRFVVTHIDWVYNSDCEPFRWGPLCVLRYDSDEFNLPVVRYWDELVAGYKRVRRGK